ncbi:MULTISPECIES: hypothetical protein [Kitasatospora]|uniref:Uncharacterized protein n=1 Tax=Kitasatospora setae (strain ATCC 33774 / DSM 43861 / JCM 3304 / KCC A-0304 / NBRC 14216 / KM-6054) TaxID=452652 RepID=E4N4V1_KITSK|nr:MULTISPECIES: hypothetical protein [Kitasatospora]BAJ26232.1 hypothetical protein KSE_03850 [Kitasatospora setae KM-6054]
MALAGLALGVGVALGGVSALGDVRALHHQPELRMTVTDCHTTGRSRSLANHCRGTGDPAGTNVATGTWTYDGAPLDYRPGTVATVRCAPDGECARLGVGDHVLALAFVAGGLLLAGGALTALAATVLGAFAPGLAAALRRPRTVRVLATAAGAALLVVLTAALCYALG